MAPFASDVKEFHRCSKTVVISAVSASGQSKLDTAAGTLASGRQTLAANRQQLAQDLYTADMDTARTEAAVWTGICIALFAAGALALAGVCLGYGRGKAVAWCTALAAILSVGCLIAMLAAGHGALRTLCLCAAVALLALAFVAAGLTLRQRAAKAQ